MNMPAPGFYAPAADRYAHMPYVRCGRSGLKLPRVSLGLWNNFGSVTPQDTARDMLLTAFDAGITYFDLANNYGPRPGAAEETLGKIMDSDLRPHRDELILATKAGYTMQDGPYGDGGSRKYLMSSLDASLRRMKVDYVDIFYHHRFDPDTPLEETMRTLADIVHQGKALYVGISNYSAEQTAQAADLLATFGVPLTIHQPRYNMLDRWIERGTPSLCDVLLNRGIGAAVFSPPQSGLADRPLLARHPGGFARGVLLRVPERRQRDGGYSDARAGAERDGIGARRNDGAVSACVGFGESGDYDGDYRRKPPCADSPKRGDGAEACAADRRGKSGD